MRILYLANNWLGWKILEWLTDQDEDIVGLVLHPPAKRKYGKEILKCVHWDNVGVFDATNLRDVATLKTIQDLKPDIGLSILFGYILRPNFLELFPSGVINLHPAYLPYNRGAYPNVWSIIDQTPAGTTLHYLDPGIDTGDIIAQREVPVAPVDTSATLYRKLEQASLRLFKETWPLIRAGQVTRQSQSKQKGTYYRTKDVQKLDSIELDKLYTARELIDIIRARTFAPYPGAYFEHAGQKIFLRLQLLYENELDRGGA